MQNDQEIMAIIFSLQNDPNFQEIMSDPGILNAVNSGDIAALISNPKFMSLLNNHKIQEIQKKLAPWVYLSFVHHTNHFNPPNLTPQPLNAVGIEPIF